jgi:sialic acid synthase SpsE
MAKLIAEVGSNHLGSLDMLEAYFKEAANAGANYIKFQAWKAEKLNTDLGWTMEDFEYYNHCEISVREIMLLACRNNVKPLFTVFDLETVDEVYNELTFFEKELIVKIASPDMLSYSLIDKCLDKFDKVLISTGMHSTEEIFQLGSYIKTKKLSHKVVLLHCVSDYPALLSNVNMARVEYLKNGGFAWGYSDHTTGIEAAVMAAAMGAEFIEKHVTLSTSLPSRDAYMSITFKEFDELAKWNYDFQEIKGSISSYDITQKDKLMRLKYIGKWGNNK